MLHKYTTLFFMTSLARANWGEWSDSAYCDFNAEVVACAELDYSEDFLERCLQYCHEADLSSDKPAGRPQCCDSEHWADGSSNCVLYDTSILVPNEYEDDGSGDQFNSFTFDSCSYTGYYADSSCAPQ